MSKPGSMVVNLALASLFMCGTVSAAAVAGDLSQYRGFHFGMELPVVAKQAGVSVSQAKVIHNRPVLIQELEWRPENLGPSPRKEAVSEVVFGFYSGELYRIEVKYDRYETEGLTSEDIVEAVSTKYGPVTSLPVRVKPSEEHYGDQDEVVARWEDPQYSFDLVRSSYGPTFKLVGVLKKLDSSAQASAQEADRLDIQEEPQRDAARQAGEVEAERAKLEKSRLVNKPHFLP